MAKPAVSENCAAPIRAAIGRFELVDDQRAVTGLRRVGRAVAGFEVGNQLVNEDPGRQADRVLSGNVADAVLPAVSEKCAEPILA